MVYGYYDRNTYLILSMYRFALIVIPDDGDYTSSKCGCLEFYAYVESSTLNVRSIYYEIFDIFLYILELK